MAWQLWVCPALLGTEFNSHSPCREAHNCSAGSRKSNIVFWLLRILELGIHLHIHTSISRYRSLLYMLNQVAQKGREGLSEIRRGKLKKKKNNLDFFLHLSTYLVRCACLCIGTLV